MNVLSSTSQPPTHESTRKHNNDSHQHLSSLPSNKRIRVFKDQNTQSLMDSDLSFSLFTAPQPSVSLPPTKFSLRGEDPKKTESLSSFPGRLLGKTVFQDVLVSCQGFQSSKVTICAVQMKELQMHHKQREIIEKEVKKLGGKFVEEPQHIPESDTYYLIVPFDR
jgi:hypothetical protein